MTCVRVPIVLSDWNGALADEHDPAFGEAFDHEERAALRRLDGQLETLRADLSPPGGREIDLELIGSDPTWRTVREHAGRVFAMFAGRVDHADHADPEVTES